MSKLVNKDESIRVCVRVVPVFGVEVYQDRLLAEGDVAQNRDVFLSPVFAPQVLEVHRSVLCAVCELLENVSRIMAIRDPAREDCVPAARLGQILERLRKGGGH